MIGASGRRVLQVHPTRLCNLSCDHCYTESGPGERTMLARALLEEVVADGATLGYDYLAISGGEPLLYPDLGALIEAGHAHGMTVAVTTNGTLPLTAQRRVWLADVDVLAISIDGSQRAHDRRRGTHAYRRTAAMLSDASETGHSWAAIFTLTRHNLDDVESVVALAADHGAAFVQVHPLSPLGRAKDTLPDAVPDEIELAAALVAGEVLGGEYGVPVLVDAVRSESFSLGWCDGTPSARVADDVPILAVMPDGSVLPLHHGMTRELALGSIHGAGLAVLAAEWTADGRRAGLRDLQRQALDRLVSGGAPRVVSWLDFVAETAHTGMV